LALQPSPGLTLLDILEKSALTGAYGFYLVAAAGTIFRCDFHTLSANRLISFCFSRLFARAFDQRPLATHCNLSTSRRIGTAFALAASRIPLREADRTRPTLSFLTIFASYPTIFHLHYVLGGLLAQFEQLQRTFGCVFCFVGSYLRPTSSCQAALCRPEDRNTKSRYPPHQS
jgi:hypothetical protein